MSPKRKKLVCDCLHVTEDDVMEAILSRKLKTVQDVTHYTEAGGGCTACHPAIKQYLAYFSVRPPSPGSGPPSCSDR